MSGIIGHTAFAILATKARAARRPPVTPVVHAHFSHELARTLEEAVQHPSRRRAKFTRRWCA